jgi:hypothetical protein
LPVVERAGRPEDEDDKEKGPEHSLNNRLPVERIHIKHQAGTIIARPDEVASFAIESVIRLFGAI